MPLPFSITSCVLQINLQQFWNIFFSGPEWAARCDDAQLEGIFLHQLQAQLGQLSSPEQRTLRGEEPVRRLHGRRLRLRAAKQL